MDKRAALSIALIVVGAGTCVLVAAGVGADVPDAADRTDRPAPRAEGPRLSALAAPEEYSLWTNRGCATCHGPDARGGLMAPDLTQVIPLYLAKFGSKEAAGAAIVSYLLDPAGSPKLRSDGEVFPNPMPALEKMFQGRREDAPVLAGMLLRLSK